MMLVTIRSVLFWSRILEVFVAIVAHIVRCVSHPRH